MTVRTIGIVDYGMGNHASVAYALREMGFRVRTSDVPEELDKVDVLVLPGVGAFPAAMKVLHERGLVPYLQEQARLRRAIVGICLGMELLAGASHEHKYTVGLELIPGEFVPFADYGWHIGWNTLESTGDSMLRQSDGQAFYFNHSFRYEGPAECQAAITRHHVPFASVIRRASVIGLQFHPEKSQAAGRVLLKNVIDGVARA